MENLEYIEWKKEYDSGIVIVDRQHRILVDLINNLTKVHKQKNEDEILRTTIIKLVDYTKFHFGYEEKHMIQNGYVKITGHKKLHKVFINQIIERLELLKMGNDDKLSEHILVFLRNIFKGICFLKLMFSFILVNSCSLN